jgi:hypothetical protein
VRVATGQEPGVGEAARYEPSRANSQRLRGVPYEPATLAHLASLVGIVAFWSWLDRGMWFFGDEWDFLVDRGLGYPPASPHGIWFPHNEHWSTLPILAWRALFSTWHLSSYWPYLALLFAVQLAVVHLAWRACRRAGATPWISTLAVAMLGLLGAGAEDWGWAFQVGFTGSVAFGLAAFDLLDRKPFSPGSLGRRHPAWLPAGRDLVASGSLLASLMCSTVGDAMVVGAAVVAFARLGWRRATKVIWPPVACYAIWFAGVGRLGIAAHSDHFGLSTFTGLPHYVWQGLSTALGQASGLDALGPALVVGMGAWLAYNARGLWAAQPALIGSCASALAFYVLVGVGRDADGPPDASRYIYVAFALLLPLIARILSGPRKGTWPPLRVAAGAVLLALTLGNVGQAKAWATARASLDEDLKTQLFALGELVAAGVHDVSGPGAAPLPGDPNLEVKDIARLEREGFLPRPPLGAKELANARAVLALGIWNGLEMTLSHAPLSRARFRLAAVHLGSKSPERRSCVTFTPEALSPAMSLELSVPPGQPSASIELFAAGGGGAARSIDAFLTPAHGPASSVPVVLALPASGHGWLDDNDPGSKVVIYWAGPGPLSLCGLLG